MPRATEFGAPVARINFRRRHEPQSQIPVPRHSCSVRDGFQVEWKFSDDSEPVAVGIDRGSSSTGPWERIEPAVLASGNGINRAIDETAPAGHTPWYRLQATRRDGQVELFGPVGVGGDRPVAGPVAEFLGGSRPNPARASTTIEFRVGRPAFVELSVFDIEGRRVRSISSGVLDSGRYERSWDGRTDRFSDAPSGIYFIVLNTSEGITSQRVVLSR